MVTIQFETVEELREMFGDITPWVAPKVPEPKVIAPSNEMGVYAILFWPLGHPDDKYFALVYGRGRNGAERLVKDKYVYKVCLNWIHYMGSTSLVKEEAIFAMHKVGDRVIV